MWCGIRCLSGLLMLVVIGEAACGLQSPNIIIFLVDDMGIMDTSVPFLTDDAGTPKRYPLNNYYRTPSMQRLADQGMRLNNFYAMSVCSPTRISIMTGQNACRHLTTNWINPSTDNRGPLGPGGWNWQGLRKNDVTLPRLLLSSGYRTIHVGKGHFGPRKYQGSNPLNLGFVDNVAGHAAGRPASYYGRDGFGKGNKTHGVPGLEKYHGQDINLTEALTLEAKDRITESVQANKPFYLYMSHYAVHAPFQSDTRFKKNYVDSGKSPKAQAYATMIEGMDKSLGDLLDHVESLGVADETLVLFLGDNGGDAPLGGPHEIACAAPLRGKKGSHYEGGMRVPFIAAWAETDATRACQRDLPIAEGAVDSQVASVCDLLPTILSVAEVSMPDDHIADGTNLNRILAGVEDSGRTEEFLMHYPHAPHRSNYFTVFRQREWKAIYHWHPEKNPQRKRFELYNLAQDPAESHDLSKSEPNQLAIMIEQMAKRLEATGAVYPTTAGRQKTLQIEMP